MVSHIKFLPITLTLDRSFIGIATRVPNTDVFVKDGSRLQGDRDEAKGLAASTLPTCNTFFKKSIH